MRSDVATATRKEHGKKTIIGKVLKILQKIMEQMSKQIVKESMKLVTIKEYQGHNGEREVVTYITYDPITGKEYDVADMYEMEHGTCFRY